MKGKFLAKRSQIIINGVKLEEGDVKEIEIRSSIFNPEYEYDVIFEDNHIGSYKSEAELLDDWELD